MNKTIIPSEQTQQQAMKVALATQKQGQTKEQTKLIAQGIEKGIALYKKQQKEKSRQADKAKKRALQLKRTAQNREEEPAQIETSSSLVSTSWLPWALLIVSWLGFISYLVLKG
ncbi:MAG: DUF2956 domain-containing protein [Vibrio anguillarum]|uniref:DUF2956 domain-containing protein n=1 Tax=Vibrio anguillarum TaxID=55601 RepID=A0ABD4QQH4_VIBAN|nr:MULTISPECIES: DUF2956 domain-containing protein [Vibrio]MBF4335512.1 DUF2956 domain-containing protein [Vibrio anguillarum]MBT2917467.1 DUF2956 domain-containing protein [Vibrio anguillarum]MDQ2191629.1 DUF2956 domain-containing protein [Vibrio sp. A14(2019)]MDQ2197333.1 DUF2956 domain-containing protein [Vibrio sp. 2017_1457_11]MDT3845632.1 DUF2956 domain-containing protein [Vibrio anguillarum]